MTQDISAEVRARLDAHLDAVEKVLIDNGRTREQRRAVVDDLESQIQEMLAARNANPTLADIEAVLGQIDLSSAYGGTNVAQSPTSPAVANAPMMASPAIPAKLSRAALIGFILVIISIVTLLPLLLYALIHAKPDTLADSVTIPPTTQVASSQPIDVVYQSSQIINFLPWLFCMSVIWLPGTILGWIGYVQIRGSNGTLRGKGMALFAGLFCPVMLLMVLVVALVVLILSA